MSINTDLQVQINLAAYLQQFLIEQDIGQQSKINYRNNLVLFFKWIHRKNIQEIKREHIIEYKDFIEFKGLKGSTRATYVVAIRRFFCWLDDTNRYKNIAKNIKARRHLNLVHSKLPLTIEQIKELLISIDRSDEEGKRDAALINLLVRTGLRLIEVNRANLGDIDESQKIPVLWVQGKGREDKDQFVVLTPETMGPIKDYLDCKYYKGKDLPLFTSLSDRNRYKRLTTFTLARIVKNRLKHIGIISKRITAHSLRHTFSVLSIRSGCELYDVQLALRHTNPATTEIYLKDIEMEKRLDKSAEINITKLLPSFF